MESNLLSSSTWVVDRGSSHSKLWGQRFVIRKLTKGNKRPYQWGGLLVESCSTACMCDKCPCLLTARRHSLPTPPKAPLLGLNVSCLWDSGIHSPDCLTLNRHSFLLVGWSYLGVKESWVLCDPNQLLANILNLPFVVREWKALCSAEMISRASRKVGSFLLVV